MIIYLNTLQWEIQVIYQFIINFFSLFERNLPKIMLIFVYILFLYFWLGVGKSCIALRFALD